MNKKLKNGLDLLYESQKYKKDKERIVNIEGCVNLESHPISDFPVSLSYGDLTLIVAILRDYIIGFDELTEQGECPINEYMYGHYYRKKFANLAEKISTQIDYDYDSLRAKCAKKFKKTSSRDVGEDSMVLAFLEK